MTLAKVNRSTPFISLVLDGYKLHFLMGVIFLLVQVIWYERSQVTLC